MPPDRTRVPESAIKNKNNSLPTEQKEGTQAQHPKGSVGKGEREVVIVWLSGVTPGCPQEGEGGSGATLTMDKQEQRGLGV